MVREAWDSFKDNIKERVSNPFLGTFTLVWIVHNWKVVYAFFYFDKDWRLQQKIDFFKNYWVEHSFIWNLIAVALITLGILVVTYLFLSLSRYMANLFENVVIPFIQKISRGKIVTGDVYNSALERISILESKVESERKAKNDAIMEREDMEKKLYSNNNTIVNSNNSELKISEEATLSTDYSDLVLNVKNDPSFSELGKMMLEISKKYGFGYEAEVKGIDFLLMHDFIYFDRSDDSGRHYNFTDKGLEFRREFFASK